MGAYLGSMPHRLPHLSISGAVQRAWHHYPGGRGNRRGHKGRRRPDQQKSQHWATVAQHEAEKGENMPCADNTAPELRRTAPRSDPGEEGRLNASSTSQTWRWYVARVGGCCHGVARMALCTRATWLSVCHQLHCVRSTAQCNR